MPTEVAEMVGGMVHVATRANGKKTLPMTTALEMLIADGKAPKVSAATVARVMKQNMCHPKQLATPSAHTQQNRYTPTTFGKSMHLSVFCSTCLKAVCK